MSSSWYGTRWCPRCGAGFWLAVGDPVPPHIAEGRRSTCGPRTTPRPELPVVLRW